MSSFRRIKSGDRTKDAVSSSSISESSENVRINGLRSWTHAGSFVSSTGNRDLDEIMGGGHVLGTMTLLETDCLSSFGSDILSYEVAESISMGHKTILIVSNISEATVLLKGLPLNLNAGVLDENDANRTENVNKANDSSSEENFDLKIAWQYAKYIKQSLTEKDKRVVSKHQELSGTYCCSYDWSRRLQMDILEKSSIHVVSLDHIFHSTSSISRSSDGFDLLSAEIRSIVKSIAGTNQVLRIFWPCLENLLIHNSFIQSLVTSSFEREWLKCIWNIKSSLRDLRASFTATVQFESLSTDGSSFNSFRSYFLPHLAHLSDTVLTIDSFAGRQGSIPYEFQEFHGFLTVQKLQNLGGLAPHRPPNSKFGIKRDRRKLHIENLHMPPEESRTANTGAILAASCNPQSNTMTDLASAFSAAVVGPSSTDKRSTAKDGPALGYSVGTKDNNTNNSSNNSMMKSIPVKVAMESITTTTTTSSSSSNSLNNSNGGGNGSGSDSDSGNVIASSATSAGTSSIRIERHTVNSGNQQEERKKSLKGALEAARASRLAASTKKSTESSTNNLDF